MPFRRSSTPRATSSTPKRLVSPCSIPSTTTGTRTRWPSSPILDAAGVSQATGTKVTFCLVDVKHYGDTGTFKKDFPRTYFECNGDLQGIAPGWGDQYHHSTPGQELEVTGLEPGIYTLEHEADPDNHWHESDDSNNHTWVRFRLDRKGANASVTVLDTSDCIPDITCGFGGNP